MLFVGEALYRPTLGAAMGQGAVPARAVLGVLVEFTAVPAVILIAATLYPVLRRHTEGLAVAYVGVRVLEGAILTIAYVALLVRLGLPGASPDGPGAAAVTVVDGLLRAVGDWAGTTGLLYLVTFGVGSCILFTMLHRARLVPQPLAGWGLLATAALLTGTILAHLDLLGPLSGAGVEIVFAAPIASAELMLAGWLLTRGFRVTRGGAP